MDEGNYTYNMGMAVYCEKKMMSFSDRRMRDFWHNASLGFARRAARSLRRGE